MGTRVRQVEKAVAGAIGGVLFIDEAYALVRDGKERIELDHGRVTDQDIDIYIYIYIYSNNNN